MKVLGNISVKLRVVFNMKLEFSDLIYNRIVVVEVFS